jgi:hypothetical protein
MVGIFLFVSGMLHYVCVCFFLHCLYSPRGPWPLFFSFMIILQTVRLLGWVIGSSQSLYLNTGQHKHRINTYTDQTSQSCVGFKPTIPASKRAKTVHALDRLATVTSLHMLLIEIKYNRNPVENLFSERWIWTVNWRKLWWMVFSIENIDFGLLNEEKP